MTRAFLFCSFNSARETVTVGEYSGVPKALACITCDVCGGGTLMKCVECDRPLCKRRECYSVHECEESRDLEKQQEGHEALTERKESNE